jgi:hypothetical protein
MKTTMTYRLEVVKATLEGADSLHPDLRVYHNS